MPSTSSPTANVTMKRCMVLQLGEEVARGNLRGDEEVG